MRTRRSFRRGAVSRIPRREPAQSIRGPRHAAGLRIRHPARNCLIKQRQPRLAFLNQTDALAQDLAFGVVAPRLDKRGDEGFKLRSKFRADHAGLQGQPDWIHSAPDNCYHQTMPERRKIAPPSTPIPSRTRGTRHASQDQDSRNPPSPPGERRPTGPAAFLGDAGQVLAAWKVRSDRQDCCCNANPVRDMQPKRGQLHNYGYQISRRTCGPRSAFPSTGHGSHFLLCDTDIIV